MHLLTALGLLAVTCSLGELDERRHDSLAVTTEGTVVDVVPDEVDVQYTVLILKDGATTLPVFYRGQLARDNFRDARVRVSGTYTRLMSGFRRFSGPFIGAHTNAPFIVAPPPADRLDVPTIDPGNYVTPRDLAEMGRRAVTGRVLAVWGDNRLMLGVGNFTVHATLASGTPLPRIGATVKVAGYPETNLYFLNLALADWRETAPPTPDDKAPRTMTAAQIMAAKEENPRIESGLNGRLIRLTGIVRSLPGEGSPEQRLYLDSGTYRVPVDLSACPSAANGVTLGCTVEATGRCAMETETWRAYDVFPQIRGFAVILRTDADLRVIAFPSWWADRRFLWIVGGLLALIAVLFVRGHLERAMARLRFGERTRLAVEIHDTLSQALTGVACQVAAGRASVETDPAAAKPRLETAERMLKSCRTELRNCLFDLRSDTLAESDLSVAVRRTLAPLAGEADVRIRLAVRRALLSETTAHALLAILRELTANSIRHGAAASVRIAGSTEPDAFRFSVRDDGRGFDPSRAAGPDEGHFGLTGVRDRLRRLGGDLAIDSAPGHGTTVRFTIPRTPSETPA